MAVGGWGRVEDGVGTPLHLYGGDSACTRLQSSYALSQMLFPFLCRQLANSIFSTSTTNQKIYSKTVLKARTQV